MCIDCDLDVFNFMPLTFVFNLEDLNFVHEIGHFFRYFKGLEIFNSLLSRPDLCQEDEDFRRNFEGVFPEMRAKTKKMKKRLGKAGSLRRRVRIQSSRERSIQPVARGIVKDAIKIDKKVGICRISYI